mgnify:FL=1
MSEVHEFQHPMPKITSQTILLLSLVFLLGCSRTIEPISYGQDDCHWCQMRIMDPKFGSEVVTKKGRTYKFDSAECLLHYWHDTEDEVDQAVVTDFERPQKFIDAREACYLVSEEMPSPMGGFLNAFSHSDLALVHLETKAGKLYTWEEILSEYKK